MKILHYLLAITLVAGLSSVAKADDFQMVIIDPTYSVNVITSTAFSFSLAPCVAPGQVPVGSPYLGCFTGQNETGVALTSFVIDIPALIQGQTAGCALNGNNLDFFQTVSCSTNSGGYILDFSNGSIPVGGVFTIAEAGADPSLFPANNSAVANTTPEPSSLLLMSTGILSIGSLVAYRRRSISPLLQNL
jgi:hypothetical protein